MAEAKHFEEFIGLVVVIETDQREQFEGAVYAVDPDQSILVLHQPSDIAHRSTFRIVKSEIITSIKLHEDQSSLALPSSLKPDAVLPKLQTAKIKEKAENAAKERASKLGTDVTIQGQDLFDALSRHYPCTWDAQTIVVNGEVRIEAPYRADNAVAGENPQSFERIRQLMEEERDRLTKLHAAQGHKAPE